MYAGRPNTISRRISRGQPASPAAARAWAGSTCAVRRSRGGKALKRSTAVSCGKPTYIMTMPEPNHIVIRTHVTMPI